MPSIIPIRKRVLRRAAAAATGDIVTGKIAQWWMDNTHVSGTDIVESVGANDATSAGGVTSVSSTPAGASFAQSRAFDGVSGSEATIGSHLEATWASATFTIAGWIYITDNTLASAGGSNQTYFYDDVAGNATNYLRIWNDRPTANGALAVNNSGNRVTTTTGLITSATWHHFAYTSSGLLYVDGVLAATNSAVADTSASAIQKFFGNFVSSDGELNGRLYDWVLFNRVLTAADVAKLYASP